MLGALQAHGVAAQLTPYDGDHGYQGLNNDQVGKLQYDAITWLVAKLRH